MIALNNLTLVFSCHRRGITSAAQIMDTTDEAVESMMPGGEAPCRSGAFEFGIYGYLLDTLQTHCLNWSSKLMFRPFWVTLPKGMQAIQVKEAAGASI
jgi:hypothetical protein